MPETTSDGPRWPARLKLLCRELRNPNDKSTQDKIIGELWKIQNLALSIYLRHHVAKKGSIPQEDLEDLAAEKTLDLLQRVVSGKTGFHDRSTPEIMSFFSKVAKNALLNLLKERGRWVETQSKEIEEACVSERYPHVNSAVTSSPDLRVERRDFTRALKNCMEKMNPRSRLVWFFRVFYEMASKDIAVHPQVAIKASHVDVLLMRSRKAIRDCMDRQGFQAQDMPPGTFTELWKSIRPTVTKHSAG